LTEEAIAALDSTVPSEEPLSEPVDGDETASEEESATTPPIPKAENGSYTLEILGGLSAGECVLVLDDQPVVVGSDETASLRVHGDELVSRRHATFTIRDGKLFVNDEGSTNGTYIRVGADRELVPGDTLALGDTLLYVRKTGAKSVG